MTTILSDSNTVNAYMCLWTYVDIYIYNIYMNTVQMYAELKMCKFSKYKTMSSFI
jgi:hypothetical protein